MANRRTPSTPTAVTLKWRRRLLQTMSCPSLLPYPLPPPVAAMESGKLTMRWTLSRP